MESTAAPAPKPGLPGWAKILLGLSIFFLVSVLVLIGACTYFIGEIERKNTDPAVVKKIANTIVTIDDPLPNGFKWVIGLDILSMKMAAVNHSPDNLELILTSLPSGKTSNSLEENISSSELNPALANATGTQSKFEAKVKGSETVANKKFVYAIGTVKDREGHDIPSLMGFFSPSDDGRAVMLVGVQEGRARKLSASDKPSEGDKPGASDKPSTGGKSPETAPANEKLEPIDASKGTDAASSDLVKAYNLEATKQFLRAIKKI
jgi:hypothetical protein